ncbi:MAG: MucR family transcriptional regulator [Candidatus Bathyarchaeota archaeon]|nr:MucR family transcriptional regulator [Candidatus Termiticorpusculum sp.]
MSEYKPPYGTQVNIRNMNLPQVPTQPEEPLRGIEPGKLVCTICGKTFKTTSGLKRHRESMHGTPERPI